MRKNIISLVEEAQQDGTIKKTPFDTRVQEHSGKIVVQSPYVIVENITVANKPPKDYIVAEWATKIPGFFEYLVNPGVDNEMLARGRNVSAVYAELDNSFEEAHLKNIVNPFNIDENILTIIYNMNPFSKEDALKFCNKFGLLGENRELLELDSRVGSIYESYEFFTDTIIDFQDAVSDTWVLQKLSHKKALSEQEKADLVSRHPVLSSDFIEPGMGVQEYLLDWLMFHVNDNLKAVTLSVGISKTDRKFYPVYSSLTLAGGIWFRLYEKLVNPEGQIFKTCLKCGRLFVAKSPRVKFCPDLELGKRSPCENSYNQMKKRARNWFITGAKTIDEIAAQCNKPIAEVKSWLQK